MGATEAGCIEVIDLWEDWDRDCNQDVIGARVWLLRHQADPRKRARNQPLNRLRLTRTAVVQYNMLYVIIIHSSWHITLKYSCDAATSQSCKVL